MRIVGCGKFGNVVSRAFGVRRLATPSGLDDAWEEDVMSEPVTERALLFRSGGGSAGFKWFAKPLSATRPWVVSNPNAIPDELKLQAERGETVNVVVRYVPADQFCTFIMAPGMGMEEDRLDRERMSQEFSEKATPDDLAGLDNP